LQKPVGWVEPAKPNKSKYFGTKFRPMGRVHFLCLPKENEPKEKTPLVLACGFTALRFLSGRLTKLAALTNLSGTNLDAEDARRVSGMDATNQTGKSLILTKSHYSPTQKGNLGMAVGWAE